MQVLQVQLQDVKVGDILLLKDKQNVPADCVMLGSKNGTDGYIQTAQLDGERNLKAKIPVVQVSNILSDLFDLKKEIVVECEEPSINMYSFDGLISIKESAFNEGFSEICTTNTKLNKN